MALYGLTNLVKLWHIKGPVDVNLPIKKFGTPIQTIGGVKGPWGITFNQRGEVVVTEREGSCVTIII